MASRPKFLSGARASSAKPKPRPPERRKPLPRRPPDRKLPPDRRPPGRKHPRREPLKPLPKRPVRRTPLFPVEKPLPKTPFGKWVPNTGTPLPPMKKYQVAKLLRFGRAFLGPLGWALTLWELYELYRWYQQYQEPDYGAPVICSTRDPVMYPFERFRYLALVPNCNVGTNTVGAETWTGQQYMTWWQGRNHPFGGQRWIPVQTYPVPNGPLNPEDPLGPVIRPMPLTPEVPYPYPYSDPPLPWTPPLERPHPEPRPEPDYDRPHWRRSDDEPDTLLRDVPSIDLTPGDQPLPDVHERRPPDPPDKEKKKRLRTGDSYKWLKFLNDNIGRFTELDDSVAAIYKGLPWKYRRWKGRDGVWRDRDINTKTRLERLYKLIGHLDIQTAVKELIKNELSDRAFGKVGNQLKKRTRELADEGLWSGFQGLGQNPTRFNKDATWDEVYKKLKKEAAEREAAKGHNWYFSRQYDPKTNTWNGVWRQRPIMQIPWYRQRSKYDRLRWLTGQWSGYKDYRPRYYYAEDADQPSPFFRD